MWHEGVGPHGTKVPGRMTNCDVPIRSESPAVFLRAGCHVQRCRASKLDEALEYTERHTRADANMDLAMADELPQQQPQPVLLPDM